MARLPPRRPRWRVAAVLDEPAGEPAALLERAHRRMSGTRGGAVAIVQVTGQVARFAGLGNVAGSILSAGSRKSMLSVPGIAGYQARCHPPVRLRGAAGCGGHPALRRHQQPLGGRRRARRGDQDPLLIAAVLLAEAGIHRDDAGIARAQIMIQRTRPP